MINYEDINIELIESIKDRESFINIVSIWKREADGEYMGTKISMIKNAIYQHFLYNKCRKELRLHEMDHLY